MFDYNEQVQAYETDCVNLPQAVKDKLRDQREALDKLLVLHRSDCTKKQAREAWDWVFQSDGFFEAYDKDSAKTRALFSKAALVNAGLASTNRAGVIVPTVVGAGVPNLAHRFYGDDSDEQG